MTSASQTPAREPRKIAGRRTRERTRSWSLAAAGRRLIDRPLVAVVLGVVVLSIGVRLPGALDLPLWQDEVASARVIVQPTLGDAITQVRATESTPPAWYVLAWLGHRAGISLEGLRIISILLSAATAGLVVVYARGFLPLLPAAVAGVLAAVGWQFVAHGRELRAYALYGLLSLAFAMLLERAAKRPSKGRLAALAACVAAGVLTHYFFALGVLVGFLWLWLVSRAGSARLRVTAALLGGLLPFLVWLPGLMDQYSARRFDWIGDFDWLKASYFYGTLFDVGGTLYSFLPPPLEGRQWLWLAAGALILVGAVVLWRRSRSGKLCAMLAVGPVAIAAIVWLAGPDVFNTRNLLIAAPFAVIAAAAPLAVVPRPVAVVAAAALVSLVALSTVQAAPLGPPADRIADTLLAEGWKPQSRVVLIADFYAFRSPIGWYLPGRPFLQLLSDPGSAGKPAFLVVQGTAAWNFLHLGSDLAEVHAVDGDIYVARLNGGDAVIRYLHNLGGNVVAASPSA